jgi:hypothetical protein
MINSAYPPQKPKKLVPLKKKKENKIDSNEENVQEQIMTNLRSDNEINIRKSTSIETNVVVHQADYNRVKLVIIFSLISLNFILAISCLIITN